MKKCKASLLLYKVFLARSQGPSVSKTAPVMRFEEWRPSFEVRKYLVWKYRRYCFEKASQMIADDRKTVLSVNTTSKISDLAPGRVSGRITNVSLGWWLVFVVTVTCVTLLKSLKHDRKSLNESIIQDKKAYRQQGIYPPQTRILRCRVTVWSRVRNPDTVPIPAWPVTVIPRVYLYPWWTLGNLGRLRNLHSGWHKGNP
jgi:hypothetical protein